MNRAIRSASLLLLPVVFLAACGGGTDGSALGDHASDADGETSTGVPADGGLTVPEALETDVAGPITVQGLLIDDGSGVRLCEAALESYPPQCGGASIEVEGVDVASIDGATTESDVSWVERATLTGELENGTLVVSTAR